MFGTPHRKVTLKTQPSTTFTERMASLKNSRTSQRKQRLKTTQRATQQYFLDTKINFEAAVKAPHHLQSSYQSSKAHESNFRHSLLNFLHQKHREPARSKHESVHSRQYVDTSRGLSSSDKKEMSSLLRQYLDTLRLLGLDLRGENMNEYVLGCLLREMSYVKSLIESRHIISRIWLQIRSPALLHVFFLLMSLSKVHVYALKNYKQQVFDQVEHLLDQEGQLVTAKQLEMAEEWAMCLSKDKDMGLLALNRQNRHTSSSLSRSLSRRRNKQ